jgi:hypothetical protein
MNSGELRPDPDVKVVSYGLLAMLNWAYKWRKSDGRLGYREVADHFTKRVLARVAAVGSRNEARKRKQELAFRAQRIAETFRTR